MKALTFHGLETIHFETVPDPEILHPEDVIVQVALTAICGSDLHVYHCREQGLDCGTTMGHEFMGRVVETGSAVRHLKKGDRVVCPFTSSCGDCFYCRTGLTSRCSRGQLYGWVEKGSGLQGAQAEFVRVPMADAGLLKLSEGIPSEQGLLLGDILSTGYFVADQAGITRNGTYVVVGCGPVGLMAVVGARELGAEKLFAVDCIPERLKLAEQFGAIPINFKQQDPVAVLREATEGRGADASMEAVGSAGAGRLAIDLIRPGGTVSVAGVHNDPQFAFNPTEAYDKNLTFRVGRCPARYYMDRLLPLVESGRYDLSAIISHRLTLDQGVHGYDIFANKKDGCTKVILTL